MEKGGMKVARIVTTERSPWNSEKVDARMTMLQSACKKLINHVDVIQTAGGYITLYLDFKGCPTGEDSTPKDFYRITAEAEDVLRLSIAKVADNCKSKADFVTLGVDVIDENDTEAHAELVATYDFNEKRFLHWTGKTYPLASQAKTLLYCMDLESHLQEISGYKVVVLGCHDLNMFSPRTRANVNQTSYKGRTIKKFNNLASKYAPYAVLQHPHFTDSPRIWTTGWTGVRRFLPTVNVYSSGIHYENMNGDPVREQNIGKVLNNLKRGPVVDIIV